jgi:hypothetical protein
LKLGRFPHFPRRYPYGFTTGDIVEVDRYPAKGTVKLQRKDGVWRYAGTEKPDR